MRSAIPRQSNPGPRFEVLPGTRTVTLCIVIPGFIWPAAAPIVITALAEAIFQQCLLAKVHAIRIRKRGGRPPGRWLQRILATPSPAANPSFAPQRFRSMPLERRNKMNFGWIDSALLRDFQAEGTDAHRLCTFPDGWVERFGRDVLISFKTVLARQKLLEELRTWTRSSEIQLRRVF